jgi:hypothetical protein
MPAVYYDNKDLSKITQITIGNSSYDVINFSFMMVKEQETLMVVYKDLNKEGSTIVRVIPFDLELVSMSSANDQTEIELTQSSSGIGGKKKKSKKSKV